VEGSDLSSRKVAATLFRVARSKRSTRPHGEGGIKRWGNQVTFGKQSGDVKIVGYPTRSTSCHRAKPYQHHLTYLGRPGTLLKRSKLPSGEQRPSEYESGHLSSLLNNCLPMRSRPLQRVPGYSCFWYLSQVWCFNGFGSPGNC
jgi:hypothetical protein